MKVHGLPRAQHDECFSSWYFRCLQARKEDALLLSAADYTDEPDFWLSRQNLRRSPSNRVSVSALSRFFREESSWVLPWEQRKVYCYYCLCEDIKVGLIPYWRKQWCYLHCPICVEHNCLLEEFPCFAPGIDKAWAAFSHHCNNYRHSVGKAIISRSPQRVIFLALQAQWLLDIAHKSPYVRLRGSRTCYLSEEIRGFCRFLFEIFLFPRFRFSEQDGLARGCQRGQLRLDPVEDFRQGALLGCSLCDVFPRVTALILIGCVLGFFPSQQVRVLQRLLSVSNPFLRMNPFDIGRMGVRFESIEHQRETMSYLDGLSVELRERIEPFIAGVSLINSLRL